jgi:DNA-binding CsgD family transcriptional regulator
VRYLSTQAVSATGRRARPGARTGARPEARLGAHAGDLSVVLRTLSPLRESDTVSTQARRAALAERLRVLGVAFGVTGPTPPSPPSAARLPRVDPALSPRLAQTLELLLLGRSEKEVATALGLSRHTVHVYVKGLYRRFGVSSRAELLARHLRR